MSRAAWSVLLVEGDAPTRQRAAAELRPRFDVWCVDGLERAVEVLSERPFDVVVTALPLPDGDGLTALVAAASMWPRSARVLLGRPASADELAEACAERLVHQALPRPWASGALLDAVARLAVRQASPPATRPAPPPLPPG
jgi:DNA-binding NtrC family response regulator